MDDFCDSHDYVASGVSQRIYDRRIHSHPAGYRNCRSSDQDHSRKKPCVTDVKNRIIIDESNREIGHDERQQTAI